MLSSFHNPDILTCLANLSSDEVFTLPNIANQMLDTLPKELWSDKTVTFLDPVSKSGVFLREITKRLIKGLEKEFPDTEERIQHILQNQVFGLGITELTSEISRRTLYCSKKANGKYSIVNFDNEEGNLRYIESQHFFADGVKCKYCGVSKKLYHRNKGLESYAYSFIHEDKPEELFNMKFDVIIGNPPYQLDTGGSGRQAKPIYQLFIDSAKRLKPRFISLIIPSRWFAGGFGLDSFRKDMLNDRRLKKLVDFENASEVFPGVDIAGGVCFFLWEKEYVGPCEVVNMINNKPHSSIRNLNEHPILIRRNNALPIIEKIQNWSKKNNHEFLDKIISPIKPFGLASNYNPKKEGIPCYFTRKIGKQYADINDIQARKDEIEKWKLLIPKAPIAGQTDFTKPIRFYHPQNAFIAEPGSCCTESWIIAASFDSQQEAKFFQSYLFTKIIRFLILQTVISQDVNKKNFIFVPALKKYTEMYDDIKLKKLFSISDEEWEHIDERILPAQL